MKKITFALFLLVTSFVSSQNVISNADFQADLGSFNSWTFTPFGTYIVPPATTANTHGTKAENDGTGDFYAFLKSENGCMYQKVAVQPSKSYSCTLIFRFITSRQQTGYGYAIETTTPLTPPDVNTILTGAAVLKPFCNNNGGVWTEFGLSDNSGTPNPTASYTQNFTFNTPADATFAYISIGTKGVLSSLQLNSVSLTEQTLSNNQIEKSQFAVYPNPATNEVTVKNIQGAFSYNIYNVSGKLLRTAANQVSNAINISDLSAGMYFLELADKNNIKSTTKLIKQ